MSSRLRCGLYLPNFGPYGDVRTLADLAAEAEAAGWDGFFIWDHVARPLTIDVADPWVALTAIALRTARLRIGALVTPLARRRPWKVARETVSIDRLSAGRLVFGVGLGSGRRVEWDDLGETVDEHRRAEMLEEGLAIVSGLWRGEPFSFDGRHYHVRRAEFRPTPVQTPRVPVWVGGRWPHPRPFRRAARWDGMFPEFDAGTDEIAALHDAVEFVRRQRQDQGPFDVVHATAPERGAERSAFAAAGVTWWLARVDPRYFGADWKGSWPLEEMRRFVRAGPGREGASGLGARGLRAIIPPSSGERRTGNRRPETGNRKRR